MAQTPILVGWGNDSSVVNLVCVAMGSSLALAIIFSLVSALSKISTQSLFIFIQKSLNFAIKLSLMVKLMDIKEVQKLLMD